MARETDWRIVTDSRDKLGESPQWNGATGELFWVDLFGPTIRRLSPDGSRKDWKVPGFATIGAIVRCADGRLLCGFDSGLHFFDPRSGAVTFFADPNEARPELVYNDAKVDRHGNFWVGNYDATESAPRGILYSLNRQGKWSIGDSGFTVCNGPSFSPQGDVLYFNDSAGRQTLAYDLDGATGKLSNRRVFQKYAETDGMPDGCCVDSKGCVWVAMYDGGKLFRLSPQGERLLTLSVPARNPTSCCFGGKDLRTLFVTSAEAPDGSDPQGGALFALDVDVPGLPEPEFLPPAAAA